MTTAAKVSVTRAKLIGRWVLMLAFLMAAASSAMAQSSGSPASAPNRPSAAATVAPSAPTTFPATVPAAQVNTSAGSRRMSQLTIMSIAGGDQRVVYTTAEHIEAPNWSPDGKWLVFNSKGSLWRIDSKGSTLPQQISTGDIKQVNNDHVLSPDGSTIYFSAGGQIYAVPFAGGQPRRISNEQPRARKFQYYLHGISPDDKTIAYAGVEASPGGRGTLNNLYTIPAAGGPDTRLSTRNAHDDGPEYSPDGRWIYFNSELNADIPGHAQCYRMVPDGTGIEQLTHDERANWFPHLSRDGKWVVLISFPKGTLGHPPDKDVILRRMKPDGTEQADLIRFNGGQGTMNVNSWSPDNEHFAFVFYPKER